MCYTDTRMVWQYSAGKNVIVPHLINIGCNIVQQIEAVQHSAFTLQSMQAEWVSCLFSLKNRGKGASTSGLGCCQSRRTEQNIILFRLHKRQSGKPMDTKRPSARCF